MATARALPRPAVRDAGGAAADVDDPQRFDLIEDDPSYQLSSPKRSRSSRTASDPRQAARLDPFKLRSAVPAAAAKPVAPPWPQRLGRRRGDSALVLYGSKHRLGRGVRRAHRERRRVARHAAVAASLDEPCRRAADRRRGRLATASYEGQPPDNAKQFTTWLEALAPGALKGVRYAVFGCGNRQWARTYQAVPKRFDAAFEAAGATRIKERGETDAGGDFFGAFEEWYGALWGDLGRALGKEVQAAPTGGQLQVDVVKTPGRTSSCGCAICSMGGR